MGPGAGVVQIITPADVVSIRVGAHGGAGFSSAKTGVCV